MKVVDIYRQYFAARRSAPEGERRGAVVALTATSEEGSIGYEVLVSFFPHREEDDFAVSYDVCAQRSVYQAKGRRSKKREAALMEGLREQADALAAELGGEIVWDAPLIAARYG